MVSDKLHRIRDEKVLGVYRLSDHQTDVFSVPPLALVPDGGWQLAIVFVLTEKIGKANKKPTKSSLMSFASHKTCGRKILCDCRSL